ncbi:hypothetical protein AIOL_002507 [Candidatus Rhodobacter oscarellae]|uniref:Phosphoadenosine phosphosulfate reductase n=1 Tax=Candidatus Rhodobacter oscarellae TaxID=1675527 RepID=A0A0J9E491_9RHOB|nr:hypothetical protein [Candidatus Rhodobacter lobularis]KMW57542.1 hypothetical protein AIOL_002507 [Candidatus Rhodobacter lobularis]
MVDEVADKEKALQPEDVLAHLADDLGREGFQRSLDEQHTATFVARGPKILVTFETLQNVLQISQDGTPIGLDFAEDKNWSLLHLTAPEDSWFRAPAVYAFFDELVDDCFFEDFDQVAFYGTGTGAYAACAFSVSAPGSNVLAIAPQATLDPERAGWDARYPEAKRLVFNDRYGYAPDMVEGAQRVYILFDPFRALDHVHASLFNGPNVVRLKCRHLDGLIELALRELDVMHQVTEAAAEGSLQEGDFYRLMRRRRDNNRYLRTLVHAVNRRNQPLRVALIAKYVLDKNRGGPFFRRALTHAKDVISRRGPLPDWLMDDAQEPQQTPEANPSAAL